MKKSLLVFLFAAALGLPGNLFAQQLQNGDKYFTPGTGIAGQIQNCSSPGTTLNSLAKVVGNCVVVTATTDTGGILGVVKGGAGTTGPADIAAGPQAVLNFDGATTAGDYVVNSPTFAGKGHDSGYSGATCPPSSQVVGKVLSTNSGAGAYYFLVGTQGCGSSGGGGGSPNQAVTFTNATFATLTVPNSSANIVTACWDNNVPANEIPTLIPPTVNPSTYVVDFYFALPQSGYCVVNSSGGGGSGGGGTVASVTFSGDGVVDSATPSVPVTSTGTVGATIKAQTANTVLAGPVSGSAAASLFRALVVADLPALTGTVTTVSVTPANGVSGSVATASTTPAISLTLGAITPSSVAATGSVSAATTVLSGSPSSAAQAALPTGAHGFACDESATAGVPASGVDYVRCDSATHQILESVNGAAESPLSTYGRVVGVINLTNQTANITTGNTIYTPTAAGYYRMCTQAEITVAATGGSPALPYTQIYYTSGNDSVARAPVIATGSSSNFTYISSGGCSGTVYVKAGTAIIYDAQGYAAGTGTPLAYNLIVTLESLNVSGQ
jgi:hypothetical protein